MNDQPSQGDAPDAAAAPGAAAVPSQRGPHLTRRGLLVGAAGVGAVAAIGGVGYALAPERLKIRLGLGPDPFIPDAPEGQIKLETIHSDARGQDVQLFTAVPDGYG